MRGFSMAKAEGLAAKRILVVVHSRQSGGAEDLALRLASDWHDKGAAVGVATFSEASAAKALTDGIECLQLGYRLTTQSVVDRAWKMATLVRRLRQVIKNWKPDIIVSHGDRTNVVTLAAAAGLHKIVVVVEHNDVNHHPIGRFWSLMRSWTYPKAQAIVGVSLGVTKGMPPSWRVKAVSIHNPVRKFCVPEGALLDPHCILAMGRLVEQKGFDLLIEAFARIAVTDDRLKLVILGEGPQRTALQEQIERLGLAERVSMPGRTATPERCLSQGAIFAFPSRYEGFGLALGEAMGMGLAVVAADCPSGPGEIIHHERNGLLVPVGDVEAMARALLRLVRDPELAGRLSLAATEVPILFSEERFLRDWEQLLQAQFRSMPVAQTDLRKQI